MSASVGLNAAIAGLPALSLYDAETFVRVDNASTGSTAYLKKAFLSMQADSATSFVLQDDSVKTHYLFADVAKPAAASVKSLLEIIQSWVEGSVGADRESGPFISDATTTLVEMKNFYDKDPLRSQDYLTSSATSTYHAGSNGITLAITTEPTSRAVRQSLQYGMILNNKVMYAIATGVLIGNTSVRNVVSKIGCFDDNADVLANANPTGNGVFFQYSSGTGLSLVLRSNYTGAQVDVIVGQAQWSIDTVDGTGASSKTLDPTTENSFVFEWSAFGGSVVRAGYLQDGRLIWCHKFVNVRLGCASVPLRWELAHLDVGLGAASNDNATMTHAASTMFLQGIYDAPLTTFAYGGKMAKAVTASTSPVCAMWLRTYEVQDRGWVSPRRIFIANLDEGVANWFLVLNPPYINANPSFRVSSAVLSEMAIFANAGGTILASGYIGRGVHVYDFDEHMYRLTCTLRGSINGVALMVRYIRGVVTVMTSIEWNQAE